MVSGVILCECSCTVFSRKAIRSSNCFTRSSISVTCLLFVSCLLINLDAQPAPFERVFNSDEHPIEMCYLLFQCLDLLLLCLILRGQSTDGFLLHLAESFAGIASKSKDDPDSANHCDKYGGSRQKRTQFRRHDGLSPNRPQVPRWLQQP